MATGVKVITSIRPGSKAWAARLSPCSERPQQWGWTERTASVAMRSMPPWQPPIWPILPSCKGALQESELIHLCSVLRACGESRWGWWCPKTLEAWICFLPHYIVQDIRNTQEVTFPIENKLPCAIWGTSWLLGLLPCLNWFGNPSTLPKLNSLQWESSICTWTNPLTLSLFSPPLTISSFHQPPGCCSHRIVDLEGT